MKAIFDTFMHSPYMGFMIALAFLYFLILLDCTKDYRKERSRKNLFFITFWFLAMVLNTWSLKNVWVEQIWTERAKISYLVKEGDGKLHCASGKLLKVYIHGNVPRQYDEAVKWAIEEWNRSLGIEVFVFGGWATGGDTLNDLQEDNAVLVAWHPIDLRQDGSYVMGTAQSGAAHTETGIGWKSVVVMNSECKFFTGSEAPNSQLFDFDSVVLHELGHSLGINDHLNDGQPSNPGKLVMYRATELGEVKRVLQKADLDAFSCSIDVRR